MAREYICAVCGFAGETESSRRLYCSDRCRRVSRRQKSRSQNAQAKASRSLVTCPTCRKEFAPKTKRSRFCSVKCYKVDWWQRTRVDRATRVSSHGCGTCTETLAMQCHSWLRLGLPVACERVTRDDVLYCDGTGLLALLLAHRPEAAALSGDR